MRTSTPGRAASPAVSGTPLVERPEIRFLWCGVLAALGIGVIAVTVTFAIRSETKPALVHQFSRSPGIVVSRPNRAPFGFRNDKANGEIVGTSPPVGDSLTAEVNTSSAE